MDGSTRFTGLLPVIVFVGLLIGLSVSFFYSNGFPGHFPALLQGMQLVFLDIGLTG
jgi:hypothetical protein